MENLNILHFAGKIGFMNACSVGGILPFAAENGVKSGKQFVNKG